jgi:hypothetical protein
LNELFIRFERLLEVTAQSTVRGESEAMIREAKSLGHVFERGEGISSRSIDREITAAECNRWLWCCLFSSFTQPYQDYVFAKTLRPMYYYRELNQNSAALLKAIIPQSVKKLRDFQSKLGEFVAKTKKLSPV